MPSQPISARPSTVSPLLSVTLTWSPWSLKSSTRRLVSSEIRLLAWQALQERAVDVGAVGHRVGLAEALHERGVERDMGDQLAGERIAHFLRRRHMGIGQHRVLEPDLVQRAEDIGSELDAGADLAELARLLEQDDREALLRQRIGGDEPADAATRDQKGSGAVCACHWKCLVAGKVGRADHKS